MLNIEELPQNVLDLLNKKEYTHTYKDIKSLEKNKKIEVKFTCEKENKDGVDYAIFDIYYKVRNKISLFKEDQLELNYRKIGRIFIKWNDVF